MKQASVLHEAVAAAFWVLAGTAGLVLCLEAGLRSGAALRSRPVMDSVAGEHRILCLGDSFTYGLGGQSYPDQLAGRLSAAGVRARVINRGVFGINSAQLADGVEDELARHHPHTVIVLVGADNFWNSLPVTGGGPWARADRALLQLRSYRLVKLLWVGVSEGDLRTRYRSAMAPASRDEALRTLRSDVESEYPLDWFRRQVGDRPERSRVEAAALAVSARLASVPSDLEARLLLSRQRSDQGDAAGAERLLSEGLEFSPCEGALLGALAAARERLGDSAGVARLLAGDGRTCAPQRRLAHAGWLLWRGELAAAAAAYRRALPELTGAKDRQAALLGWADALYRLDDFDGAIARLDEAQRSSAGAVPLDVTLRTRAWARKWESSRRLGGKGPPPKGADDDLAFSHYRLGEFERCADLTLKQLEQAPLSAEIFHLHALCQQRRGRLWEALGASASVPAVRDNLFYRYLESLKASVDSSGRGFEDLLQERFEADVRAIVLAARRHGANVILASYPEEEYAPVRRAAEATGAAYLDFIPVFKARFRSREQFVSSDRCHLNTAGYAVMAEEFEKALRAMPGFPAGGAR